MGSGAYHNRRAARIRAFGERVVHASEVVIVTAAELLVVISIIIAAAILYILFFQRLSENLGTLGNIDLLQDSVERVFAGVLLLMLGLELLKSLKSFFTSFEIQVEIIMVVAIIAVARHVMLIDPAHSSAMTLIGAAALVLALALSYALVRQRRARPPREKSDPTTSDLAED